MKKCLKMLAVFGLVSAAALLLCACALGAGGLDAGSDVFSSAVFAEDLDGAQGAVGAPETPREPGQTADESDAGGGIRRAVWISYLDLEDFDMSSRGAFEADVAQAIQNLQTVGCTDILLQVRAFGEALYDSDIFPDGGFVYPDLDGELDVLEVFLSAAHGSGMRLHAWINPYRLSASDALAGLRERLVAQDPHALWQDDSGVYIVPSSRAGRELVVEGVEELLARYPVDGIHFDDYFYPTATGEIDEQLYADYRAGGGNMSIDDYRRFNVSELVGEVYAAAKSLENPVEFGVSPDASVSRDRAAHYADVSLWGAQEGYVDYLCPQVYYGFVNESMPFEAVVSEWRGVCMQCELWVGLAFYKAGVNDRWAGSGENEWLDADDIIARQYAFLKDNGASAAVFYRYGSMFGEDARASAAASAELDNLVKTVG